MLYRYIAQRIGRVDRTSSVMRKGWARSWIALPIQAGLHEHGQHRKTNCGERRENKNERHPPPQARARPVAQGTDAGLEQKGDNRV